MHGVDFARPEPVRCLRVASQDRDIEPIHIGAARRHQQSLLRHQHRAAEQEGAALASRAPLDLRVNTLKATREAAAEELAELDPQPTRWSPTGLRVIVAPDSKSPAIHAEPAFLKGQIEIQDEGSQVAALCAGAKPGEQVVDLCAGAGGKTLALAAAMAGRGQIFATDSDKRRLAPIHERIARADAR